MSKLEEQLALQMRAEGISGFDREVRFAAEYVGSGKGLRERLKDADLKDWRFDFANRDLMLAFECDGATWTNGRHNRGAGFESDKFKYAEAAKLGWTVIGFTAGMIKSGYAINTIKTLIDRLS